MGFLKSERHSGVVKQTFRQSDWAKSDSLAFGGRLPIRYDKVLAHFQKLLFRILFSIPRYCKDHKIKKLSNLNISNEKIFDFSCSSWPCQSTRKTKTRKKSYNTYVVKKGLLHTTRTSLTRISTF